MKFEFGSVCSGIEAASVAWESLDWKAAWLAEIEPFPSSVLARHYPNTPNLGDMTTIADRITSGEIKAPDLLVGGTPCQAFSVAGLRGGLSDERGALSISFVRLANAIDDVRNVGGKLPAIIVWENVPGVLSSKDNAFGCFLAGLAGESEPLQPSGGKWTNAGCVFGPQRAVAWRILDAQYFGVAQRRRRVFVVASARDGFNPAEVLFEREGVRRDTAPSRKTGEGITHDVAPCLTSSGRGVERTGDTRGQDPVIAARMVAFGEYAVDGTASTCKARDYKDATDLVAQPIPFGVGEMPNVGHCLRSGASKADKHESTTYVAQPMAFDTTQITSPANRSNPKPGNPCHPLAAEAHAPAIAFSAKDYGGDATNDLSPTLRAGNSHEGNQNSGAWMAITSGIAVRRLTQIECERLQGFPDGYTDIKPNGKPTPDGPRYKALGNSMAVPVMRWIGQRIKQALTDSLSDVLTP